MKSRIAILAALVASVALVAQVRFTGNVQGRGWIATNEGNGWVESGYEQGANTFTTKTRVIGGCPLFPDNSYWYARIDTLPLISGSATIMADTHYTPVNPGAVSAATWNSGTATVTVASGHGVTAGNTVWVTHMSPATWNAAVGVTVSGVTATTISYPLASDPGAYSSGGFVYKSGGTKRMAMLPDMPINLGTNATPTYTFPITTYWHSESRPYPIDPAWQLEGYYFGSTKSVSAGPWADGIDNHLLAINTDTCELTEHYHFPGAASSSGYTAESSAKFNLLSNNLRTKTMPVIEAENGLTSADAAGLPIAPGVLTYDEALGDQPITHALRVIIPASQSRYVWPATHHAQSGGGGSTLLPMGARLRLKASFDTTQCQIYQTDLYPSYFRRLLTAMQQYGLIVADNGAFSINSTPDQRWGDPSSPSAATYIYNGLTHCVLMSDFEVVDMRSQICDINSGRVAPCSTGH